MQSQSDLAAKVCVLTKQLGSARDCRPEDEISVVKFSPCGRYVALGDNSGRLIIFGECQGQLKYFTEIAAHKHSHEWQTNKQVPARITSVHWLETHNNLQILTSNQKYIKIWRTCETTEKELDTSNGWIPEVIDKQEVCFKSTLKAELPDLHYGLILHTALSDNQETLITADRERVFRWSLDRIETAQLLFERKQCPMEEEEDKEWSSISDITAIKFHMGSDSKYAYSTKFGMLNYVDSRYTSKNKHCLELNNIPAKVMQTFDEAPHYRFMEIVSDFMFTDREHEVITRNYYKSKLWDIRNPAKPVRECMIFPQMVPYLQNLINDYDHNKLRDQFKISGFGRKLITNHYDSSFHLLDFDKGTNFRVKVTNNSKPQALEIKKNNNMPIDNFNPDPIVNCVGFHPSGKKVAVSSKNCVYFLDTMDYS